MLDRHRRNFVYNRIPIIHPVTFYDDCNGTYDYTNAGDGADYVAEYSTDHCLVGTNSIKLRTKATAPGVNDAVSISKYLWLSPLKILTLEGSFGVGANVNSTLTFLLYWYDETYSNSAGLRFNHSDRTVLYLNNGATYTTISGFLYNNASSCRWNHFRFKIDLSTFTYLSWEVNHFVQSPTAISHARSASATANVMMLYIVLTTLAAAQPLVYIDQLVVRADNP